MEKTLQASISSLFSYMCNIIVSLSAEILEKSGEEGIPDLSHIMHNLRPESIPNLPPGGGLASK